MCGIAGIIRPDRPSAGSSEIRRMATTLAHRGPDGEGFYLQGPVAIGHKRLAIIDLEGGRQPLSNEDGSIWVTFNGEIYNYRELTTELKRRGHRFATQSDTEVIIHAFEQWGEDCVKRFRGMFAFGIVDYQKRSVLLARDHVGIKPLYYRTARDYFAFASELDALCQVHDDKPKGNLFAVDLYLRYQYIPTPHTIYHNVYKLPPASTMTVGFDGKMSDPKRYWDMKFNPKSNISEDDWLDRLDHSLREAVRDHLIADVPVGVLVSGGIDSTLIAHYAAELTGGSIKGFALGFDDKQACELPYARQAAQRCGIDLSTQTISHRAVDRLPEIAGMYGEPFGDNSALATWHVSALARGVVPVVLSGDGGDEVFAGYDSYMRWMSLTSMWKAAEYYRAWPRLGIKWAFQAGRRRLYQSLDGRLRDWLDCITHTPSTIRRQVWKKQWHHLVERPSDLFVDAAKRAAEYRRLDFSQYMDFQTYLPCDIMTKVDIASMRHGLEARPPLLDQRIIELAASMPHSLRFRGKGLQQPIGKYPLKHLLARSFDKSFVYRPKQGFAMPTTSWFDRQSTLRTLVDDVVLDPRAQIYNFLDRQGVQRLVSSHTTSNNQAGRIWLLLMLGLWMDSHRDIEFSCPTQNDDQHSPDVLSALSRAA